MKYRVDCEIFSRDPEIACNMKAPRCREDNMKRSKGRGAGSSKQASLPLKAMRLTLAEASPCPTPGCGYYGRELWIRGTRALCGECLAKERKAA